MQSYTGHVVSDVSFVEAFLRPDYDLIPPTLQGEAVRVLNGQQEATVDITGDSRLAKFAAKRRKVRAKIAKASKRRNRK